MRIVLNGTVIDTTREFIPEVDLGSAPHSGADSACTFTAGGDPVVSNELTASDDVAARDDSAVTDGTFVDDRFAEIYESAINRTHRQTIHQTNSLLSCGRRCTRVGISLAPERVDEFLRHSLMR